eukprot:gnl/TRDRNA2_/TRDRNA2_170583_c2_seq2.p1 gnl/TRDRNA2_/TRDRNA2_170583_c2~~gnl/TRDRNA2_/TRDRNA2_170583_c2_seq2.p1  ORF type:complete len:232 (+),score=37.93 gnl/TRDRNA2_/TRDRNA2_170583_c2_seq2:353-1048(+)
MLSRSRLGMSDACTDHSGFAAAFAQALLAELGTRGSSMKPGPRPLESTPWEALCSEMRRLDEAGSWLLVVDGLELGAGTSDEAEGPLRRVLEELIGSSARLCLLLTSRGRSRGWPALGASKITELELPPLAPRDAALLFARRARRPLYLRDFERYEGQREDAQSPLQIRRADAAGGKQDGELVPRLADSALLRSLCGVPGRIVSAASLVDASLPSLLEHPDLSSTKLAASS